MFHLHDLFHSVSVQCYRMLIICSPEICFPQWLNRICGRLPAVLGISCFGRFTSLKLCFIWRKIVSFLMPIKRKNKQTKKTNKPKLTLQNKTEINLVIKTEINLPSEKRKKKKHLLSKSQATDFQLIFSPFVDWLCFAVQQLRQNQIKLLASAIKHNLIT